MFSFALRLGGQITKRSSVLRILVTLNPKPEALGHYLVITWACPGIRLRAAWP